MIGDWCWGGWCYVRYCHGKAEKCEGDRVEARTRNPKAFNLRLEFDAERKCELHKVQLGDSLNLDRRSIATFESSRT